MNWDLLLKYVNNQSTTAEQGEVEAWLDEQAENQHLLGYLQKRRQQLQQPLSQTDIHEQWVRLLDRIFEQRQATIKPKPNNGYWFIGIAASLLVVSLLGWYYHAANIAASKQLITLQTPANKCGKVTLPDGSTVYLAANTKLTYTGAFGDKKREMRLYGEAFFNVKHNTQKPFVIYTPNNITVAVLGTSFNVYARANQNTEVKVATGLVGVTVGDRSKLIKAGSQFTYQITSRQIALNTVAQNDAASLQNQSLFFKDSNAADIAQKLHRWYNIDVKVDSSAKKHPRFSGEMHDTGIDDVLKGLGYATGLQYRYTNTHSITLF